MAIALSGCGKVPFLDDSHGAVAACEERLKSTLVSPASYKRLSTTYDTTAFSFEDYYESRGGDECGLVLNDKCELSEQIARATGAKSWLLSKSEYLAGRDPSEILMRDFDRPLPKVSMSARKKADKEFIHFIYDKNFGPNSKSKLPAAIASIEYDAVNQYNAPLRSQFACRFIPTNRDKYISADIY